MCIARGRSAAGCRAGTRSGRDRDTSRYRTLLSHAHGDPPQASADVRRARRARRSRRSAAGRAAITMPSACCARAEADRCLPPMRHPALRGRPVRPGSSRCDRPSGAWACAASATSAVEYGRRRLALAQPLGQSPQECGRAGQQSAAPPGAAAGREIRGTAAGSPAVRSPSTCSPLFS